MANNPNDPKKKAKKAATTDRQIRRENQDLIAVLEKMILIDGIDLTQLPCDRTPVDRDEPNRQAGQD